MYRVFTRHARRCARILLSNRAQCAIYGSASLAATFCLDKTDNLPLVGFIAAVGAVLAFREFLLALES